MVKTLIIAEAGVNHNGSIELAHRLIDAAKDSGADIVKFQTFKAEKIISKNAQKADYQKNDTNNDESQLDMIKKLELDVDAHLDLINYCKEKEIEFLSTPFDLDSIELLHNLGIKRFKIPSGEITNYPYLKRIAEYNKQIIMSTGMADMNEIKAALKVLLKNGTEKSKISILHCNTEYPTPFEDVNLNAMLTIGKTLKCPIGYSDHSLGIEVPIAAVSLGATIIEKHFTLDKKLPGPDHKASLEPHELKAMVSAIRNIEKALGNGIKVPSASEVKNKIIARKSIVALKNISKDEKFSEKNITVKRPGNGISPMRWNEIIGKKAKRDYNQDDLI